jgi:hypothetical protein
VLEGLENRVVLSTIQWNTTAAPGGGAWDTPGNWVGGVVPGSSDTAVINLTKAGTVTTGSSDSVLGLQTNASTTVSVANGTLTLGAATSTINGPLAVASTGTLQLNGTTMLGTGTVTDAGHLNTTNATLGSTSTTVSSGGVLNAGGLTVQPGATLSVGANVPVQIGAGQTLADDGTISFGSGDSVSFPTAQYATTQLVVNNGAVLSASGTNFINPGNAYASTNQVVVNSGGELKATGSTFGVNQLILANGSVLNSGDMSGNVFNLPIYVPASDIPLLAANKSFQNVNILGGTLNSGQSLSLNLIGTTSTANLLYIFSGGFTVQPGATLSVGANVPVQIGGGQAITDNGSLSFASGDAVYFATAQYATTQIVVNGTMSATGTNFINPGNAYASTNQVVVNSGGELKATGSTFGVNQLTLANGSVLQSTDLANDIFNLPIYVPALDIPLLAANRNFQAINILAGSLNSGTLSLNLIGTASTANLLYAFPSGFTVQPGATLSVGANVPVQIGAGQTLADDGTISFGSGDSVSFPTAQYATTQLVVNNGAVLNANGTTFINPGNAYASTNAIQVNSGGHLIAQGSTFGLNQLNWAGGSVLNSGDMTANVFATAITAPITDVPLLANNQSFQAIYILGGSLNAGQSLTLGLIGSKSTAGLDYIFPSGFAVQPGATLTIGPDVPVQIGGAQEIIDDGTLNLIGDAVSFPTAQYATTQLVVNSGGVLSASGTAFINPGNAYASTNQIVINSGGQLNASNSTFGLNTLALGAGSSGQLAGDVFNTQLAINSGTKAGVTGGSFSNGTVVASGDPNATINLTNNYWGTTNTTQIAAKITDHTDNSSLPTVNFTPFLSAASTPGAATAIVASSTAATYNANASQSVTLTASVTSGSVKPNAGTVTFLVANGLSMIGNPVTASVNSSGVATATLLLPAGTVGGTDTILAIYNGTATYLGSIDASHTITVNPATATTTATAVSDTFSALGAQTVNLSAKVTSANGTVNEGTETFTVLAGSTPIGPAVTVPVVNGAAGTPYTVPAGTKAGPYTIQAVYSGTPDFNTATGTATLTVGAAATTTTAVTTTTTYSDSSQTVKLTATVNSGAGTVNEASVTFTVLSGSTTIGSPVSVPITNGTVSANYTLPQSLAGGNYTIKAVYGGGQDFSTSSDSTHTLTVTPAATTIAAKSATITFSTSAQTVPLTATVTSPAGTVGEGSVTFTVLNGSTVIGTATAGNVAGGSVTVNYTIPASEPVGTYTIKAVYGGTAEFLTATDMSHTLTIGAAAPAITTAVAVAGAGAAPVEPGTQAAPLGAVAGAAGTHSAAHRVHRSSSRINRGPLSIGRTAHMKHPRTGPLPLVADGRPPREIRPRHVG